MAQIPGLMSTRVGRSIPQGVDCIKRYETSRVFASHRELRRIAEERSNLRGWSKERYFRQDLVSGYLRRIDELGIMRKVIDL